MAVTLTGSMRKNGQNLTFEAYGEDGPMEVHYTFQIEVLDGLPVDIRFGQVTARADSSNDLNGEQQVLGTLGKTTVDFSLNDGKVKLTGNLASPVPEVQSVTGKGRWSKVLA
ncbi:hypothetical protein [Streptomyces geysiriensis]|uniref:hypothetical protein n=1 Tax=Streptomyces geysiriensis TaxID=68207 RepID=UPI001C7E1B17|nr:hypothetical protein [Streptomyces geysiriensis]MBX4177021.1 hypothetical protein [Streptomyces geysiriensis]